MLAWPRGPGDQNSSKQSCCAGRATRSLEQACLHTGCPQGQHRAPSCLWKSCSPQVLIFTMIVFVKYFNKKRVASWLWQFETVPPSGKRREHRMEVRQEGRCHSPTCSICCSQSHLWSVCPPAQAPWVGYNRWTRCLALGHWQEPGQERKNVGPKPGTHLVTVPLCVWPEGHWGALGCSPTSPGDNWQSLVSNDAQVPCWEAQVGTEKKT